MNVVGKVSVHTYLDMMDEQTFYGIKEANDTILSSALVELEVLSEAWKARETALTEAGAVSMPSVAKVERRTNGIMDSLANFIRKVIQFLADIGNKFGQVLEEFKKDAEYVNSHLQDLSKIMDPPNDTYKEIQKHTTLTFIPYYSNADAMNRLADNNYPDGAKLDNIVRSIDSNPKRYENSSVLKVEFPKMGSLADNPRDAALAWYRGETQDKPMGAINVQGENIKPALQEMIKFTTQDYARYHTAADNLRKALNKSLQAAENKLKSLGAQETQIKNTEVKSGQQNQGATQNTPQGESFTLFSNTYSILEEASLSDTEFNFLTPVREYTNDDVDKANDRETLEKIVKANDGGATSIETKNRAKKKLLSLPNENQQAGNSANQGETPNQGPQPTLKADDLKNKSKDELRKMRHETDPSTGKPKYNEADQKLIDNEIRKRPAEGAADTKDENANNPNAPKQYETEQEKEQARTANENDQAKQRVVLDVIKTFQSVVTAKMTVMEEVEKEYMRVLRGVINGLTGANTQMERNAENKRANNAQDRKEEEEHQRKLTATRRQGEQLKAINKANKEAEKGKHGAIRNFFSDLF